MKSLTISSVRWFEIPLGTSSQHHFTLGTTTGHADDVSRLDLHASGAPTSDAHLQTLRDQLEAAKATALQARRFFTHNPQIAFLLTPTGRVIEANVQASLALGIPASALAGRRIGHFLTPDSQTPLNALLNRVFASAERVEGELVMRGESGACLSIIVAAQLMDDSDDARTCQMTVTNVTPLKRAHLLLLDEVEALRGTIRTQELRNRRLDDEVHDVVQATHVQLHLQLSRLQSCLNLHQKEVHLDGRTYAYLGTTQDVLGTSFVLLESLNQYLRARELRLRRTSVDLNRVVAEVRKDLHGALAGRDVKWTSDPLPTVLGDSRALQMVFQEYVSNALKFTRTREVAHIHIRVKETQDEYMIGVEDDGVGFSMRHKDKVFDLFARLHPQGTYEGTGLGLAVVRRLAERSGVRVWGEGKVDQGATFWLAYPKEIVVPV